MRHLLFLIHPWGNRDRTSFSLSSCCCPRFLSAPGTSMGHFALAARKEPGTAPHVWGIQGVLADPVSSGGVWTLHRSQFLAIKTVPASAEPVCGGRGSVAHLGLSRCCSKGRCSVWARVCPGATCWGQGEIPAPWAGPLASTCTGRVFKGIGGLTLSCPLNSNSSSTHSLGCFGGCICCFPQLCSSLQVVPHPLANKCEFTE